MELGTDLPTPVPVGTRLVHIGPSKTGTTSLQAAMWAARTAMREQGVLYAGRARHNETAARAAVGLRSLVDDRGAPPPARYWTGVVREIRRSSAPRVIFSSEFLAHASPDDARRIVHDLDPARVHVAVTLRPLARMLPSQWQQSVQAGRMTPYEQWLRALFGDADGAPEASLWHRHRHDRLVERWAEIVGSDRITVVVADDRDHEQVLRAFEGLLGLRRGTLELQDDLGNRSLTLAEVEALRALNIAFRAAHPGKAFHAQVVRNGVAVHMKTRVPGPDEPRIETPPWALDRAAEVAREVVAGIAASGVRVVGDLERLAEAPAVAAGREGVSPVAISPAIAASMSMGMVLSTGLARGRSSAGAGTRPAAAAVPGPQAEPAEIGRLTSRRVAGVLVRRVRIAGVRRWSTTRHRLGTLLGSR